MPGLNSRRVDKPLPDDDLFLSLRISEHGTAIRWNDGLDISAVWLRRISDATKNQDGHTYV